MPLRTGEKIRKIKILFMVWSQIVFRCLNSYMKKCQCSKLNTHLTTIFLSEWENCVYIEIPLRPQHSEPFENMSAVMLHFHMHICEYRMVN